MCAESCQPAPWGRKDGAIGNERSRALLPGATEPTSGDTNCFSDGRHSGLRHMNGLARSAGCNPARVRGVFRQLPVRDPDRLVLLSWNGTFVGSGWGSGNLLPRPLFRDLKAQNEVFDGMFARHPARVHFAMDTLTLVAAAAPARRATAVSPVEALRHE